ncbi:MAG: hypothetical protein JNM91_08230 [Flavobacteriales bacterium]|nr:hypothetical protein [Flavobacteriales bacterium]
MINRRAISLVLIGSYMAVGLAHASEWQACDRAELEAAMKRAEENLVRQSSFAMDIHMISYPDPQAAPADESHSTYLKDGAHSRMRQMGLDAYQNDEISAVADPEDRLVVLGNPRPLFDALVNQRATQLLVGAERLLKRTDVLGTEFRIMYQANVSAYSHVDVRYDAHGNFSALLLQWRPTTVGELDRPPAKLYSPRVRITFGATRALTASERADVRSGLGQRLVMDQGRYSTIGPWAGYHVVDTRIAP